MLIEAVLFALYGVPAIGLAGIILKNAWDEYRPIADVQKEKTLEDVQKEMEQAIQYSKLKAEEEEKRKKKELGTKKTKPIQLATPILKVDEMMEWYARNQLRLEKEMIERRLKTSSEKSNYLTEAYESWKREDAYDWLRRSPLQSTVKEKVFFDGKEEEKQLKDYLRNVCYRGESVVFQSDSKSIDKGYYVCLEEDKVMGYALVLIKNGAFQMNCLVDNQTFKIKDIGFGVYEENERYLVRHYFEKVIQDYLPIEVNRREKEKEKEMEELWTLAEEIQKEKEEEKTYIKTVNEKYQTVKQTIITLVKTNPELSAERKHKLYRHYLAPMEEMIRLYKTLSIESKREQEIELLDSFEKVEQSVKHELEVIEKEKVFEFKKQIKVLKQRTNG